MRSVAALVFLPPMINSVDHIPSQCSLLWVPVPSTDIKHVNSKQSYKWLSYSWSQCLRMMAHSELHAILCDVLSSFAARYILHDDPHTPLTLAHARDSSGDVDIATAGAPTKTPVQGCLEIHVHIYQSSQRPGIDAYLPQ